MKIDLRNEKQKTMKTKHKAVKNKMELENFIVEKNVQREEVFFLNMFIKFVNTSNILSIYTETLNTFLINSSFHC